MRRLLPQVKAIAEALDDNTDLLVSTLGGLKLTAEGSTCAAIFDLSFCKMRDLHSVVRHADSRMRHALLSAAAAMSRVLSGRRLTHVSTGEGISKKKQQVAEGTIQAVQRRHFANSGRLVSTEPSLRRIFKVLLLLRSTFSQEEDTARRNGAGYGLSSLPTAVLWSEEGEDKEEKKTKKANVSPFCTTAVALADLARAHDITVEGEGAIKEMAQRHCRDMFPPLFASIAACAASGSWSESHCHQVVLEQLLHVLVSPPSPDVGVGCWFCTS